MLAIEKTEAHGDEANVSSDGEGWERYQKWKRCAPIFDGVAFRGVVGNFLYSSIDGRAWTSSRLPTGFNTDSIFFSNGKYFVSGGAKLIVSTDAVNWTAGSYCGYTAPVFAFGKWFAGGRQSPDGLTWNSVSPVGDGHACQTITEIGGEVYVRGSYGIFIKTTDGSTWTTVLPGGGSSPSAFQSTAVTAEGFVKPTCDRTLTYTRDLADFADFHAIPLGTAPLESIAVGDGIWLGVGDHGTIVRCAGYLDLAPIEDWRKQAFGITSGTTDAADSADPDSDGKPNLLAYALGGDPRVPDGFNTVHTRWHHSGALTSGFLTFPCDAFRSDIDWKVWLSYDGLSSWVRVARCAKGARCVSSGAWSVDDPYPQNSSGAGHQRNVMVEVRSDHRAAFLRLVVVRNP